MPNFRPGSVSRIEQSVWEEEEIVRFLHNHGLLMLSEPNRDRIGVDGPNTLKLASCFQS